MKKANTRLFGEIEIADEKIIKMKEGIIGFPNLVNFTLIHNEEKGHTSIKWLQSLDDPIFALPVMNPLEIKPDYRPLVNEEGLALLGDLSDESIFVLVTITVPKEIEKMSVNLKAPFVININNMEGKQMITENDYPVKYMIYDLLKNKKAGE